VCTRPTTFLVLRLAVSVVDTPLAVTNLRRLQQQQQQQQQTRGYFEGFITTMPSCCMQHKQQQRYTQRYSVERAAAVVAAAVSVPAAAAALSMTTVGIQGFMPHYISVCSTALSTHAHTAHRSGIHTDTVHSSECYQQRNCADLRFAACLANIYVQNTVYMNVVLVGNITHS
jgi:hypothetical protein